MHACTAARVNARKNTHETDLDDFDGLPGGVGFRPTTGRSAESCAAARTYAIDDGVRRWRNHTEQIHGGGCASGFADARMDRCSRRCGDFRNDHARHRCGGAEEGGGQSALDGLQYSGQRDRVAGGAVGYMAPGAPPGPYHHYIFELYGLDTKLDLGPDATRADVLKAMDGH